MNLQENRYSNPNFRQIQCQDFRQSLLPINRFGIFHGRRNNDRAGNQRRQVELAFFRSHAGPGPRM